jgi:hypothetical protein
MIDIILAFVFGVASVLAFQHFAPKTAQGQPSVPLTLEAFGQVLEHTAQTLHARFDALEVAIAPDLEKFKMALSDALNELKAAADTDKAKAVADAQAAAQTAASEQEAKDEQAVRDFTATNYPPAA